jgi:hypothetical protein
MSGPETQASQGTLRKELGLVVLIFLMIGLKDGRYQKSRNSN